MTTFMRYEVEVKDVWKVAPPKKHDRAVVGTYKFGSGTARRALVWLQTQ